MHASIGHLLATIACCWLCALVAYRVIFSNRHSAARRRPTLQPKE